MNLKNSTIIRCGLLWLALHNTLHFINFIIKLWHFRNRAHFSGHSQLLLWKWPFNAKNRWTLTFAPSAAVGVVPSCIFWFLLLVIFAFFTTALYSSPCDETIKMLSSLLFIVTSKNRRRGLHTILLKLWWWSTWNFFRATDFFSHHYSPAVFLRVKSFLTITGLLREGNWLKLS